ncbi:hypothetical protein GCM10010206_18410 [Streptomyces cinerochromogenes]|nr:hypothetical protein GCM10010206_18410 [Streptomyces cinerochromogenes]
MQVAEHPTTPEGAHDLGVFPERHRERTARRRAVIVDRRARYAVVDVTGVPTADSSAARQPVKTVAAARPEVAERIVPGARPALARTTVRLGIDPGPVTTRAGLADALAYALTRQGAVVPPAPAAGAGPR